jgi:hypothetical protein
VFDFLRARGEEFLTQVSNELMSNPRFIQAMQAAVRGKEWIDDAVARALRTMNVPTRTEFKRAVARIDALERELAERSARPRPRPVRRPGRRSKRASRATKPACRNPPPHRGRAASLPGRVLRRLAEVRPPESLVAIDIAEPPSALRVRHRRLDFTEPASDQRLLELLREEDVETVVHAAFFTNPRRDSGYAHELESIGTLNLLAAAAAAGVQRVILRSFTTVRRARAQPELPDRGHALQPSPALAWVRDKLEAEQHAAALARRYRRCRSPSFASRRSSGQRPHVLRASSTIAWSPLMGYDPWSAPPPRTRSARSLPPSSRHRRGLQRRTQRPSPSHRLSHGGRIPVFVPHPVAYAGADVLWAAGLGAARARSWTVRYLLWRTARGAAAARLRGAAPSRDAFSAYSLSPHAGWQAAEATS